MAREEKSHSTDSLNDSTNTFISDVPLHIIKARRNVRIGFIVSPQQANNMMTMVHPHDDDDTEFGWATRRRRRRCSSSGYLDGNSSAITLAGPEERVHNRWISVVDDDNDEEEALRNELDRRCSQWHERGDVGGAERVCQFIGHQIG